MRRAALARESLPGVPSGNTTQEEDGVSDPISFALKNEDSAPSAVETVQPRRVRSQLVALDGRVLAHQDHAEDLFEHVTSTEGRTILRRLYTGLEATHDLLRIALKTVDGGG